MSAPIITPDAVRLYLMDRPEFNTLMSINWEQEQIEQCLVLTVDAFNRMSPPSKYPYTLESFPSMELLLTGTCAKLLISLALNHTLNQFSYSADGTSVTEKDKGPMLQAFGSQLWQEFRKEAQDLKVQFNIARAS